MEKIDRIIPKESTLGDRHTSRHNEAEIDVYKLIHATKEMPAVQISVNDFIKELQYPCWTDKNENKITPQEVIEIYKNMGLEKALETYPHLSDHLRQIHHADYSHPILMYESSVIDGMHRLAKAHMNGEVSIEAKILDSIPKEAIIKIHSKED